MPNGMPEQLEYLAPVLDELSKLPPRSMRDDDTEAFAIVDAAVRSRVKGLGLSEAREAIKEDLSLLDELVELPDGTRPVAFVYGVLSAMIMFDVFAELSK
jgi:hypothetical protein